MTGDEIRDARQRAHLTQDELGAMIGVTGRTIGNWERSYSVPRNRQAALEEALSMTTDTPVVPLGDVSDAVLLAEIARRFERGKAVSHDRQDVTEPGPETGSTEHGSEDRPEDGSTTRRGAPMSELERKQAERARRQAENDRRDLSDLTDYAADEGPFMDGDE